jgi:hypothetical protein
MWAGNRWRRSTLIRWLWSLAGILTILTGFAVATWLIEHYWGR